MKYDNVINIAFDTPLLGNYVVITTNEFDKGTTAWGWPQIITMVFDKKPTGFKVDVYSGHEAYQNIDTVLNWVALPI